MITPLNLMTDTATLLTPATATQTDGAPLTTFGSVSDLTVQCAFQPASSAEALSLQRELGTTTYDIYFAPSMSDGTATGTVVLHSSRISIGGVTYRMQGDILDLCNKGVVLRGVCARDT